MKNIEFTDKSWNPITGCENWGKTKECAVWKVCWAYKMACRLKGRFGYDRKRPFKPTFHLDRLKAPYSWKKPKRIATCYMGDIFSGPDFKDIWFFLMFEVIRNTPRHTYLLLTKSPQNAVDFEFPKNVWLGVTVNNPSDNWRVAALRRSKATIKYISFEPLEKGYFYDLEGIDWIIIGAQTNPYRNPPFSAVRSLIKRARSLGIPIFLKDNLYWPVQIREFPGD